MLATNGHPQNSILLFAPGQLEWFDAVCTQLTADGFTFEKVTTATSAHEKMQNQHCDAIIAGDSPDSLELFTELRGKTIADTPLLVMIQQQSLIISPDERLNSADAILPPSPAYITAQLQTMLRLREENQELKKKAQTLTTQVESLQAELEIQKRSSGEIEILKNAIVRTVSHELKTPLLQVKSAIAMLAEDVGETTLMEYAKNATGRLEVLVKNIAMLGSSLDINIGPVIIRDAIDYARRNLGRVWLHRGDASRIKVFIDDSLPPVMADKQGLSTILQLLMDNALKFSEKDIEIHAHQEEGGVRIAVKDYGIGIANDKREEIFSTFYQIDQTDRRRYGGTGIGLALVKLILDHHGVQIDVDSQEGKGSTFSFKLKIAKLSPQ